MKTMVLIYRLSQSDVISNTSGTSGRTLGMTPFDHHADGHSSDSDDCYLAHGQPRGHVASMTTGDLDMSTTTMTSGPAHRLLQRHPSLAVCVT
jgi:hypothetical protein